MSIPINSVCIECHLKKRLALARELGDDNQATAYAKEILEVIAHAPEDMDSTWLGSISDGMMQRIYNPILPFLQGFRLGKFRELD